MRNQNPTRFSGNHFSFVRGRKTFLMGILNLTPDSFSDGGDFFSEEKAIDHALEMQKQGADLIDVGAMSTRPGSEPVSAQEEIRRLSFLEKICRRLVIPVSVDTIYPETARYAVAAGASIINDVSGAPSDEMAELVRESGCGYVLMYRRSKQGKYQMKDGAVVEDAAFFFQENLARLLSLGLRKEQLCLDPGFGFAKNTEENLALLRASDQLRREDVFWLSAFSRKRFLGELTGVAQAKDRDPATAAVCVTAIQKGADILRVHNISLCRQAAVLADAVYKQRNSKEG